MEELLQILLEETEAEERSYWYSSGDAESSALNALAAVIKRVQYRLKQEK